MLYAAGIEIWLSSFRISFMDIESRLLRLGLLKVAKFALPIKRFNIMRPATETVTAFA